MQLLLNHIPALPNQHLAIVNREDAKREMIHSQQASLLISVNPNTLRFQYVDELKVWGAQGRGSNAYVKVDGKA